MIFPTRRIAAACRDFMIDRSSQQGPTVPVRLVQFSISPETASASTATSVELHIVLFPADAFSIAKQFWQHTGLGISSRLAEHCLAMLPDETKPASPAATSPPPMFAKRSASNRHYANKPSFSSSPPVAAPLANPIAEELGADHVTYLEERYGRNLPVVAAAVAKRAMRRRIAGTLVHDTPNAWSQAGEQATEVGPSTRGVSEVSEDDVFLYPTGMSAIFSAHQLALGAMPPAKSICFGHV
jgi:cystathionine gamma-synthase